MTRGLEDFSYNTTQYRAIWESLSEWLFVPNAVLDYDDACFVLIDCRSYVLCIRCLIDSFVHTDNIVVSFPCLCRSLDNYNRKVSVS